MGTQRFYRYGLTAAILIILLTSTGGLHIAKASRAAAGAVRSSIQADPNTVFLPCIFKPCQPTIIDNFSDLSSGWQEYIFPIFSVGYGNSDYVINITTPHNPLFDTYFATGIYMPYQGADFKVIISARASQAPIDGYNPQYGLIFDRYDDIENSITKFFAFEIATNGTWYLWWYDSTAISQWIGVTTGYSTDINQGTALNRLGVEKSGSLINVYANGHKLNNEPINDTYDVASGYIGVIGENQLSETSISYYFDDFGLYPVSCDWAEIQASAYPPIRTSHLTELPVIAPSFGWIEPGSR